MRSRHATSIASDTTGIAATVGISESRGWRKIEASECARLSESVTRQRVSDGAKVELVRQEGVAYGLGITARSSKDDARGRCG